MYNSQSALCMALPKQLIGWLSGSLIGWLVQCEWASTCTLYVLGLHRWHSLPQDPTQFSPTQHNAHHTISHHIAQQNTKRIHACTQKPRSGDYDRIGWLGRPRSTCTHTYTFLLSAGEIILRRVAKVLTRISDFLIWVGNPVAKCRGKMLSFTFFEWREFEGIFSRIFFFPQMCIGKDWGVLCFEVCLITKFNGEGFSFSGSTGQIFGHAFCSQKNKLTCFINSPYCRHITSPKRKMRISTIK